MACKDIRHAEEYGREYFEGSLKQIRHIMTDITDSLSTSLEIQEPLVQVTANELRCEYCCQISSRLDNFKRHICKQKADDVRYLEIELDLKIDIDIHSKQCRFCFKDFSQKGHCTRHLTTCPAKQEYKEMLEAKHKNYNRILKNLI